MAQLEALKNSVSSSELKIGQMSAEVASMKFEIESLSHNVDVVAVKVDNDSKDLRKSIGGMRVHCEEYCSNEVVNVLTKSLHNLGQHVDKRFSALRQTC